ncbi:purine-cytosine permease family protein [Microlunatus flavus]|uniref:NCS1 nucleoside transporter family n=1 Tax=Microlunatus flavus TaxID=1036181 RepID=A0A1H9A085_9ACTN|nr:cytosine permease [Microlunatus flavus]SEP69911.1 NCS1 nucleoside transporter family [Microlunatus flavus]
MTVTDPDITQAQLAYGTKVVAVEPGGVEPIPEGERHGRPVQLLWTWASPNFEFATIAVGILSVLAFGLTFWQAVGAIVLGTLLGSVSLGVLSTWGPREGLAQMVLSRTAFGYRGNVLPAGLNALTAGIGWFAVNSISGALALNALTGLPAFVSLVIVVAAQLVVAFFGHNLVHAFERYAFPVLAIIFVIGSVIVLSHANPGAPAMDGPPPLGGFLITAGAAFGYAAGWNPYSSDYTRYLPKATKRLPIALFAGLGCFLSCCLLEIAGAAVVTAGQTEVNPSSFTALLPSFLGKLTLLAVCLGAVAANVLNVYSGAMSFMALGVRLGLKQARAVVAVVFGILGLVVASFGLRNAGASYEAFLLVIAYWIAPWLGVVYADRLLRRGQEIAVVAQDTAHRNLAGVVAMVLGLVVSIPLFSNQELYTGPVPKANGNAGDLTALVGFVVAAVAYVLLFRALGRRKVAA